MQGVLLHKNTEPCAPPVFIWGNCRSQGFGIVTTTEQDPNTVGWWRLKEEKTNSWLTQDVTEKGKFGFINLPAAYWKVMATLTFVTMLLVCFFSCWCWCFCFVFEKPAQSGQQVCVEASQQRWFTSWQADEKLCGFFLFSRKGVCLCVFLLSSASREACVTVLQQSSWLNKKTSHLQPGMKKRKHTLYLNNSYTTRFGIRQQMKYASLVLNLIFLSFFFLFWILHWWLSFKSWLLCVNI